MKNFTAGFFMGCLLVITGDFSAQAQDPSSQDSFFLAKKRGILGRIGRSISRDGQTIDPVKTVNPFISYKGKIIRSIEISPLGFNRNLNDTLEVKNSFPIRVANALHKNSSTHLIRNNLFFAEGDKLLPLLFADNERFLREQPYLQDALIVVFNTAYTKDSVDVLVLTRDVFSLGGTVSISNTQKARVEAKEENLSGTGNRLSASMLYDRDRRPVLGFGGEFIKRNIKGLFLNWTTGFTTFNNALVNYRYEETKLYTAIEKPLVSRYTEWTGAIELSYNRNRNVYADTMYESLYQYSYHRADIWGGYNFGARDRKDRDSEKRLRHFVALRGFYNKFSQVPVKFQTNYDYNYADINGGLISYSLYKQNFYRTNFIYGFGRNEDVPEGMNASVVGGYTNKQGRKRTYLGFDYDATHYSEKGFFTNYTFRIGGFISRKTAEDIDLLAGISHFTKLRNMGSYWRNRNFVSVSFTRQIDPNLNQPLFLESDFGLPYLRNGEIKADSRTTIKLESVFYNLRKISGFRIAPFIFTDLSLLKPIHAELEKTNGYSAFGGGFRTRNENLIFGTIEVKGYYFPRKTYEEMRNWKLEISTNIKFKYNSSFIKKPDFVVAN
ncbi:MAG: hypothetical protein JWQ27_2068 [Ferruginibacter sp.]|nr:hypothetical protein [Ferruginibacter sp.]